MTFDEIGKKNSTIEQSSALSGEIREVEIAKISVNPYQPRRNFGKEELEELADSIKTAGLIQPPVVRWCESRQCYEIISGERRFRAAYLAGLQRIPVLVRDSDEYFSAEAALIENIQRVDLNAMEIARALQELKKFGVSQDDLGKRVGKKRSTISNYFRLLDLPSSVQIKLQENEITMGHAKAILSVEGKKEQEKICELIIDQNMSVRDAEELVSKKGERQRAEVVSQEKRKDPHVSELEEKIEQFLGTKVAIQANGSKGKICIDYYSLDDLERLMECILPKD